MGGGEVHPQNGGLLLGSTGGGLGHPQNCLLAGGIPHPKKRQSCEPLEMLALREPGFGYADPFGPHLTRSVKATSSEPCDFRGSNTFVASLRAGFVGFAVHVLLSISCVFCGDWYPFQIGKGNRREHRCAFVGSTSLF